MYQSDNGDLVFFFFKLVKVLISKEAFKHWNGLNTPFSWPQTQTWRYVLARYRHFTNSTGDSKQVLTLFNTCRHASINNRNRTTRQCSFIIYLSIRCFEKGVCPETLRIYWVVLLKSTFFWTFCVFGYCLRTLEVSFVLFYFVLFFVRERRPEAKSNRRFSTYRPNA